MALGCGFTGAFIVRVCSCDWCLDVPVMAHRVLKQAGEGGFCMGGT